MDNSKKIDPVQKLAESMWAMDNSDAMEAIADQNTAFLAVRPSYLQRARLLLIKVQNRGGSIEFK